jgi:hypothetical protein
MFLPQAWLSQLENSLQYLHENELSWGVLGCWGARADRACLGHIYSSGLGILGHDFDHPLPVQTLDEIVLIVRKSSGLSFHDALPGFHFYGTDICMSAAVQGLECYVLPAFAIHNTAQILKLPADFYACYAHAKRLWKKQLPIQTTCIRISRFNSEVYWRKLRSLYQAKSFERRTPAPRVVDPGQILEQLTSIAD